MPTTATLRSRNPPFAPHSGTRHCPIMSQTSADVFPVLGYPQNAKRVHREVRFGAYILGSTLGEGEFGKVKLGWRKDGKQPSQVAIKLIKRDTILKDLESEVKIHREINLLKLLSHPNIVNLVEVMKSGKYIGIVLEYASGGELFDYILHHKYLKENVAKKLFAQLVSGVDYMHCKGLVHRDLKLENLLLDKHKNVIISDFGFVNSYNRDKNDLMKTSCGLPCYAAPELVLTQSPYEGKKVDIWLLGVILYAMLSGYLPFDDDPENEDGSDIVRLYHYICKTPLTFPEYVSPLARDLLRKIIVPDPRKRINMNEIRAHPWLAPYANLLSIRQPEWDRIHRDNSDRHVALVSQRNKRFSMVNEKTNSSLLMMNAHGRSYSSTNIVYTNPLAPTTSLLLANAVALPKTEQGSLSPAISPVNLSGDKTPSPTKQLHTAGFQRGHTKSASLSNNYTTASIALKAVVSENDNKRSSIASLDLLLLLNASMLAPPTSKGAYYQLPQPIQLPRSTTYTGTISTIVESPTKTQNTVSEKPSIASAIVPPNTSGTASSGASRDLARLPHAQKKPRPTSYHPSSITSSLITNNGSLAALLDYIKIPSPINMPLLQFMSTSPTKASPISETPILESSHGSPSSMVRTSPSRRNSVVTHVHVNGVLTSDLNSHENKRNSVLSYLEDKMDTLELTELHSPTKSGREEKLETVSLPRSNITPQINQLPTFAVPTTSPVMQQNDLLPVFHQEITPEPELEALHTFKAPEGPEEKEASEKSAEKASIIKESTPEVKEEARKVPSARQLREVSRRDLEKENRHAGRPRKDTDKENMDAKKKNRFSLLSFYSTYNSSSSNVASLYSQNPAPANTKKILEPSSEANMMKPSSASKDQKRINSNSSSKTAGSKKLSHSGSTGASTVSGKEASAARKVMDFFKRRSVKIG